ncbi:MAG: hypothetical protein QOF35_1632 [Actinomycetota bacterium]|jgi:hypothetical protein|nr:hypothetical protein [Actinomycetota bacterium]
MYTSVAAGAARPDLSLALNVLATPFWIGGIAVYVLLGRARSPRLAWTGGTLLVAGLTALAANLGTEIMTSYLVRQTTISPAQADHATRTLSSPPASVMSLLFAIGVGLGIPLTAASLWRSGAVPRLAAALLVAFLVLDLAGQSTIPALSVIAHIIGLIAASWMATAVLRMTPIRPQPARGRTPGKSGSLTPTT